MRVAAVIHPSESGGFWSEVPSLPGVASQGRTQEEIVINTQNAVRMWVAYLQSRGQKVPVMDETVVTLEVEV
jgi:predicted RNase H-like HicB family nuclease